MSDAEVISAEFPSRALPCKALLRCTGTRGRYRSRRRQAQAFLYRACGLRTWRVFDPAPGIVLDIEQRLKAISRLNVHICSLADCLEGELRQFGVNGSRLQTSCRCPEAVTTRSRFPVVMQLTRCTAKIKLKCNAGKREGKRQWPWAEGPTARFLQGVGA